MVLVQKECRSKLCGQISKDSNGHQTFIENYIFSDINGLTILYKCDIYLNLKLHYNHFLVFVQCDAS